MYMWGSSTGATKLSGPHALPIKQTTPPGYPGGNRYSQIPFRHAVNDREDARLVNGLEKGGRGKPVDCKKFQRDLRDVSFSPCNVDMLRQLMIMRVVRY